MNTLSLATGSTLLKGPREGGLAGRTDVPEVAACFSSFAPLCEIHQLKLWVLQETHWRPSFENIENGPDVPCELQYTNESVVSKVIEPVTL